MDSIVLIAAAFLLNLLLTESKLSKSPAAVTVVRVGSFVKLECFTENKGYPPSWTHLSVGSSNAADVYLVVPGDNNQILGRMTQTYHNRGFMVKENRETGEYSLEIDSVKEEDAGEYKCQARGGLGQSASAQLTAIDSSPECASNLTGEVLGSNSCGKEPDIVALTCTFRIRGNSLPQVMWVKTGFPDSVIKVGPAQWTDQTGLARSEFIVKACREDLTESSFTCIVQTSDCVENYARLSCDSPRINVLENSNITEYRTVSTAEEVQCDLSSFKNNEGCKWVRRDDYDEVVSETQQLNLYRPNMKPGTYVCIVKYIIRGEVCQFEALGIKYTGQPPEAGPAISSQDKPWVAVTAAVVVTVSVIAIAFAVAIGAFKLYKKQPGSKVPSTKAESLSSHSDKSPSASVDGEAERGRQEDGADRSQETEERDELIDKRKGGNVSIDISKGIDEGDSAKQFIPGSRAARLRALEEKAALRMRMNALRGQENPGFSAQDEGGDVAEGIPKLQAEKDK